MSPARVSSCGRCGAAIVWAETSEGRRMPLDAEPLDRDDPRGNIAAMRDERGQLLARVLRAGEEPRGFEKRAMPHFATCTANADRGSAGRD